MFIEGPESVTFFYCLCVIANKFLFHMTHSDSTTVNFLQPLSLPSTKLEALEKVQVENIRKVQRVLL